MLKHNEANPLSVHQLRRIDFCPPHFTPVLFDLATQEKTISDWIWENLEGRFCLIDYYQPSENGGHSMQKMAAFEQPGEASYFALILNTVNSYNSHSM